MDAKKNFPILVYSEGAGEPYVAQCVFIPECQARGFTEADAIGAVRKLLATRIRERQANGALGLALPVGRYNIVHVPVADPIVVRSPS